MEGRISRLFDGAADCGFRGSKLRMRSGVAALVLATVILAMADAGVLAQAGGAPAARPDDAVNKPLPEIVDPADQLPLNEPAPTYRGEGWSGETAAPGSSMGGDSYTLRGGSLDSATRNLQPLTPDVQSRAQTRRSADERIRAARQAAGVDATASETDVRATAWSELAYADYNLRIALLGAVKRAGFDARGADIQQFDLDGSGGASVALRLHERTGDRIILMWMDGRGQWRLGPSQMGSDLRFRRMPAGLRPGYLGEGERAPLFAVMLDDEMWGLRPRAAWMPIEGLYVGGRPRRPQPQEIALATLNEPASTQDTSNGRLLWSSFFNAPPTPQTMFAQDVSLTQIDLVSADARQRRLQTIAEGKETAAKSIDPAVDRLIYLYVRNPAFCAEQGYACRFLLFGPQSRGAPLLAQGVTAMGLYLVQKNTKISVYGFSADGGIFHVGAIPK